MRVLINAQLDPEASGGIAQVLSGLAHGFARRASEDPGRDRAKSGDEIEVVFVCSPASAEWLRSFVGRKSRIEINRRPPLPPVEGGRESDGFFESFEPDVVHFPYQAYTRVAAPTVFNPHDLQHIHLPEYFSSRERRRRNILFGDAFAHASAVAVGTEWVANDVRQWFESSSDKLAVIPWGSPAELFVGGDAATDDKALERFDLRAGFALYPAQTWPHKNHLRLVEAVNLARLSNGSDVRLVCTGHLTDHFPEIQDKVDALGLGNHVRFLGRVSKESLAALYRSAGFVVIPTMFEAGSFPLLEAFSAGVPAAVSNVTSLPEIAGGAALLFDPTNVESIARAICRLHDDASLRQRLVERAFTVVSRFTWSATAQAYTRLYQKVASQAATSPPPSQFAATARFNLTTQ